MFPSLSFAPGPYAGCEWGGIPPGFPWSGVVEHFAVFRHSQRWPEFTIRECHHQRRKDEDAQQHGRGETDPKVSMASRPNCTFGEEPLHERTIRAEDFLPSTDSCCIAAPGYSPIACCRRASSLTTETDHITRIGNDGRGTDKPEFRKCHIVRVNQAGAGGIRGWIVNFGFMVVYPMLIVSSQLFSRVSFPVQSGADHRAQVAINGHGENLDVIAFAQFLQSGFQRAAAGTSDRKTHTGCML